MQSEDGVSYSRVLSDTAVTFKASAMPTRAKKQKGDADLGVTPLTHVFIPPTPMRVTAGSSLSRMTSMITRPVPSITTSQAWDSGMSNLQEINNDTQTVIKQPCRDFNQNILMHMDQFGNPVWVQGIVEQPVICTQVQEQQPQVTERQLDVNPMNQSIEALRANPFIQQLVEEWVAVLESRMKSELQQGSQPQKKSRRYNIADTPHTFAGLMNPVWLALSVKNCI